MKVEETKDNCVICDKKLSKETKEKYIIFGLYEHAKDQLFSYYLCLDCCMKDFSKLYTPTPNSKIENCCVCNQRVDLFSNDFFFLHLHDNDFLIQGKLFFHYDCFTKIGGNFFVKKIIMKKFSNTQKSWYNINV